MKRLIPFLLCLFPLMLNAQGKLQLKSPNNQLSAQVEVCPNDVELTLSSSSTPVLKVNTVKFDLEKDIIEGDWILKDSRESYHCSTWQPVYGENSMIKDCYNELNLLLQSSQNQKEITLQVRLYDEGLAFRYQFDPLDFWNSTVNAEHTSFLFDSNCTAWASDMAQSPAYETTLNDIAKASDRPLVIRVSPQQFVAIGEAALVNYFRMKLKKGDISNSVQSELSGNADLQMADYTTPWRYVLIGNNPAELLARNYLVLNLNEPNQIENTSWIKPGKVIREITLTDQGAKSCIDFAVRNNFAYVEFDAGWYGAENSPESDASAVSLDPARSKGPLDLQKVIEYANIKGIGILLYVNRIALKKQLDQILPLYKKWGIKGVKFGFVDVGDQYSTAWLHQAVRKAAKYELMVDIHDEYRPTGYSRTYPNLMTQEGIRGDEESPSTQQSIYTLFTRMIAGAGDYTNCYFADRVNSEKMGGKAAQMAKAISLYSPWQFLYWYDRPVDSDLEAIGAADVKATIKEGKETDFYKNLPTVWDESKILEGVMGKKSIVARRSGDTWYIGMLNADEKQPFSLPLEMLNPSDSYTATIYSQTASDLKKNQVNIKQIPLKGLSSLSFTLEKNSGCAVVIKKN